jgi:hypothetical protein
MRFLGIGLSDRVPDACTIWLFREKLTRAGAIGPLFGRFDATLRATGYIAMSGQIVDASLVAASLQRNTQAEKDDIKAAGCRRSGSAGRPSSVKSGSCWGTGGPAEDPARGAETGLDRGLVEIRPAPARRARLQGRVRKLRPCCMTAARRTRSVLCIWPQKLGLEVAIERDTTVLD